MSRITHLLAIARALPPTPLRPANSAQLADGLASIVTRAFPATTPTPPTPSSPSPPPPDIPAIQPRTLGPSEERAIEEMRLAIDRIGTNFALEQFPLSDRTLRPPSDPLYYKRTKDGVHRAQQGKGRTWWKAFFQVKGEA